nr:hypothetical protein [uncultured Cohaesibacter sp.]
MSASERSESSTQGQSVRKGADDANGQQQGRKRRRSRSRRRKNNASSPDVNATSQTALSKERQTSGADGNAPLNGRFVSEQQGTKGDREPSSRAAQHTDDDRAHHQKHDEKRRARRGQRHRRKAGGQNGESTSQGVLQTDSNAGVAIKADQKHAGASDAGEATERKRSRNRSHERSPAHRESDAQGSGNRSSNSRPAKPSARANGAQQGSRPAARPERTGDRKHGAYAALDLGTNNCRLLIAEPQGQSFQVVDAFSRIVRLGEGLSQSGNLSADAQDRAIAALKVCQSKLSYRSVKRFRLIATEACRRASNGAAFLNRVYRETGLKLEIVDRETEARLAVAGCASLVHPEADGVVLFDIGGGSSEIVWLDLDPLNEENQSQPGEKKNRQARRAMRQMSERIRCWTSLQVGVVTLSEKHGGRLVTKERFETMVNEVRGMLDHFEERKALAKAIETKHIHMLGTSGTVTTLAGVHLGLERYDRRQVDGTWLSALELRAMIGRVLSMDFEERMKNPCIGEDRADLVLAGCAILEAFHREWPCSQLRVADRGLREGILMEMMIDDGVWAPRTQKSNGDQGSKSASGKKRRSRRRGSRGHRGGQGRKPAS